jgi:hypothetical protein
MMNFYCSENMTKQIGSTLIGYKFEQKRARDICLSCLLAACDKGLHVDLKHLRNTSTARMEPEEIRFFGENLACIFPHKGLIAF